MNFGRFSKKAHSIQRKEWRVKPNIRNVKRAKGTPLRWVVSLLLMLAVTGGALFGAVGAANADDNKTINMYSASSNLAAFFANGMQPGSSSSDGNTLKANGWPGVLASPATAGDLLGFADQNLNPIQWFVSQATSTTQSPLDYDLLGLSPSGAGARQYGEFGATLSSLGLDSTATGLSSDFVSKMAGMALLFFYWASSAVNAVFNFLLTILSWLNPFKFMYKGVQLVAPKFADGLAGHPVSEADVGVLAGFTEFIGGIYKAVSSLSWAVMIPLFIAVTVFGLLLFKPGGTDSRGGKIRKLFTRMAFIVMGIPLLGSMYSNILPAALEMTSGHESGSTQVIASTLVDFRAWSTQARLAVPSGATISWDENAHSPSRDASTHVQDSALAINMMVHPELGVHSVLSTKSDRDWQSAAAPGQSADASHDASYDAANALLWGFINNEQVDGAAFASNIQGELTHQNVADAPGWFKSLSGDMKDVKQGAQPVLNVEDGSGLTTSADKGIVTFTTPKQSQNASCGARIVENAGSGTAPLPCSMSAMSVYNYLNTDFGDHALTVYSSAKLASSATQKKHDAVTLVGAGGLQQFLNWLEALSILASFTVIGIFYAGGMFAGNLKHGVQVFTATPFALLGALPAITKVCVFTVAMVVEVFGTLFVYQIFQQLVIEFPRMINNVADQFSRVSPGGAVAVTVYAMATFVPFLMIIVLISTTVMALRLRKSIVKALNEVSTKIIENLIGGKGAVPGGPGSMGKLAGAVAGGVAGGAGMALGGRMMGENKGPAAQKSSGPEEASANASGTVDGSVAAGGQQNPEPGNPAIEGASPQESGPGGGGALTGGTTTGTGASAAGPTGQNIQADKELGARVAQHGLTALPPGDSQAVPDTKASGTEGSRTVSAGGASGAGDVLDTAVTSHERTRAQQQEANAQKRAAATSVAGAAFHGGIAAARGAAGDVEGAARSGSEAVGSVQRAQGHAMRGRETQKQINTSGQAQLKQDAGSGIPSQTKQVSEPEPKVQAQKPQPERPAAPTQVRQAPRRTLPVHRDAAPDVQEPR